MKIIKAIDKSHMLQEKDGMFFVNKYYISNDKFLLSKDYMGTELLKTIEDNDKTPQDKLLILDNIVNNTVNDNDYKNATISNLIIINDKNEELRIIYSDSDFLAIDNRYIKLFGLEDEKLQIRDINSPLRIYQKVEGIKFITMGIKLEYEEQCRIKEYLTCQWWNCKSLMNMDKS